MNYIWKWDVFAQTAANGEASWLHWIAGGIAWTIAIAILSGLIAFLIGSAVGVARTTSSKWLVRAGDEYVELFRNIPLLVQLFVWYFVLPELLPFLKSWVVDSEPVVYQAFTAVVCLGLYTSARVAEQVRAGIQAIGKGKRYAGYAIGLSEWQTYRFVLLPIAYRLVIPPLTSELMNLVKNTSVALTIGLADLMFRTREMGEATFRYFEAFTVSTCIYLCISLACYFVMSKIEQKTRIPGLSVGEK